MVSDQAAVDRAPSREGEHLHEAARALLAAEDADRVEAIRRERWIPYPKANDVVRRLEDLLTYPKTHRMPNVLLVGETNNGKTKIVRRFERLHPWETNAAGDGNRVPVLYVQAPPGPDEGRFYNRILSAIVAPYNPKDRVEAKEAQVFRLLRRLDLGLLIIDEIHDIISGPDNKRRYFLNVIKHLGNELQIPIVGVGTYDAFRAIQSDPQLANRFRPLLLPRWTEGTEWRRLLLSFERRLPLRKPSGLTDAKLSALLLDMTEGLLGELSSLLTEAGTEAIRTGRERIDRPLLKRLGWVLPSRRQEIHTLEASAAKSDEEGNWNPSLDMSSQSGPPAAG